METAWVYELLKKEEINYQPNNEAKSTVVGNYRKKENVCGERKRRCWDVWFGL